MHAGRSLFHRIFASRRWIELFGIDPRTLAVFRIAVAAVLLYNLAGRAVDLESMYGPHGLLPIDAVQAYSRSAGLPVNWSLYFLDSSLAVQAGLFGASALFALTLAIGFFTRASTVASWVLLASLHARAPILVNGGDILLSMLLFWGMFLPLGCRFSIDAWRLGGRRSEPLVSIPAACILLQVFMMYLFTGWSKLNSVWFGGEALEHALSIDMFVRPFGRWLLNFPGLLAAATPVTLALELICPLLLFLPWGNRYARPAAIVVLAGLHIGIELTMTVAMFSYASLAALSLFLPAAFWNNRFLSRAVPQTEGKQSAAASAAGRKRPIAAQRTPLTWIRDTFCLLVIAYLAIWNTATTTIVRHATALELEYGLAPLPATPSPPVGNLRQPSEFVKACHSFVMRTAPLAYGLRIDQRWDMFSHPPDADYRIVARAELVDGSIVDTLRGGAEVKLDDPEALSPAIPNVRWMLVHMGLSEPQHAVMSQEIAEYLRRSWDAGHPPRERIASMQLILLRHLPVGEDEHGVFPATIAEIGAEPGSWIERDIHGTKIAEGPRRYGRRVGQWRRWYPGGQKKSEGRFAGGVMQGPWQHWHENGRQESAGAYREGKQQGPWRHWHENGKLSARGAYQADEKHGPWTHWHPTGEMASQGAFQAGKEHGAWKFWDDAGQLEGEGTFVDGEFEGRWTFYENGKPRVEMFEAGKKVAHKISIAPEAN